MEAKMDGEMEDKCCVSAFYLLCTSEITPLSSVLQIEGPGTVREDHSMTGNSL